jgi:integrase
VTVALPPPVSVVLRYLLRDLRHMGARAASDLADWLVYLELEGKADRTLYSYHREAARLLRAYPDRTLAEITHREINDVLQTVPAASRPITRSVLNRWFEWAVLDGRVAGTPMLRVPRVRRKPRLARGVYSLEEVAQLEALPLPDGQLFTLLFGSGLRRGEARRLRREHIDLDRGRLIVRRGKGDKDRAVVLTPDACRAVADLDLAERLDPEDHLWYCRPGGGRVVSRRMAIGNTTYGRWYATCVERAGVRYLPPHSTRHTYHELMRLAGLTLEERQLLMGHSSISTTADLYGHLDLDEVAAKLADYHR